MKEVVYPHLCTRHRKVMGVWCLTCKRAVCPRCSKEAMHEGHKIEAGVDERAVVKLWLARDVSDLIQQGYKVYAQAEAVRAAVRLSWGENVTLEGPREDVGKVRAKLLELQEGREAGGRAKKQAGEAAAVADGDAQVRYESY